MKAVVVGLVLVSGLSGLSGCSKPVTPTQSASTAPPIAGQPTQPQLATQPKMTRAELREKLKGLKTGHDVIAAIGKPSKTDQRDAVGDKAPRYYLWYSSLTVDEVSGVNDSSVVIELVGYGLDSTYVTYAVNP